MKKNVLMLLLVLPLITGCGIKNVDLDLFIEDSISFETLNELSTEVMESNFEVSVDYYYGTFGWRNIGSSQGSATIIKKEEDTYYLLTNYHVVTLDDDTLNDELIQYRYHVSDYEDNDLTCQLEFKNSEYDMALLSCDTSNTYHVVSLSDTEVIEDDAVIALSSPEGGRNIITAGNVLYMDELEQVDYDVIYHSALLKKGSSGSMLLNTELELVGINTWGIIYDDEKDTMYGVASPVSEIKEFLEENNFSIG